LRFTITEPIYGSELYVFVGEPKENLAKHQKRAFPEYSFDGISSTSDAALCGLSHDVKGYLWIEHSGKYDPYHIAVLAHEMSHWCFHIMDQIGNAYIHKNEDEPFAYLLRFMIEEFYAKVNRRKKK